MVDTAGTLCKAAEILKEGGARRVYAFCSHGVLSGPAAKRIANSVLTELVVLDTIPLSEECAVSTFDSIIPFWYKSYHRLSLRRQLERLPSYQSVLY